MFKGGLQIYIRIIFGFIAALLQSCFRVVRQVVLPSRRKKGNLISSLLLLFVDVTEHITGCRQLLLTHPVLPKRKIPAQQRLEDFWSYSKKRLRQITFIVSWLLFILSLLEWTHPARQFSYNDNNLTADVNYHGSAITQSVKKSYTAIVPAANRLNIADDYALVFDPVKIFNNLNCLVPSSTAKRWLLLRTLRI